jgi:hypothetical protein
VPAFIENKLKEMTENVKEGVIRIERVIERKRHALNENENCVMSCNHLGKRWD